MATRRLTDRHLDLDTLEVLERVAHTGSLSRAAESLGITQQAVSARVRVAERLVGQPLVHRTVTGSVVTETGRLVLGLASPVLEASRRLEAGVAALRQPAGSLVVAASQTIAEMLLPTRLLAFRAIVPDVTVRLIAGNSTAVAGLVRSGTAHLGFVEGPASLPDLRSEDITDDEMIVVVSPDHPWARRSRITAADLADVALLLREEGSGTRATLENWLMAEGLSLAEPAAVLETTGIIRASARAGIAPAVMSLRTVENDRAAGALVRVPLDGPPLRRSLRAVWAGQPTAAVAAFLEVARRG